MSLPIYMTTIFKDLFLKNTLSIKTKFHVKPPWEGGKNVYINGPGQMTKMASMPIYDKNLHIMKTCPCNDHPLTPHFHIGKLGFTRVYIIFLFLL